MTERPHVKPMPDHAQRVFQGEIFDVWQWEQELFDDSKATFERLKRPDYAHITVIMSDKKIMLVNDEQPDRDAVLTPAGGKVDGREKPENAARRELLEETGYEVERLKHWHTYRPSTKIEYNIHGFIGSGPMKANDPAPEGGEKIQPQLFSFDEFIKLGRNPMLRDWMLRIILLEAELDQSKQDDLRKLFYD